MSDPSERRSEARFITILPLSILDGKGGVLDGSGTAHDVTPGGFKAEVQHPLEEGQLFHFSLDLPDGRQAIKGQAKAVWVKKHEFAVWVGGKIVSMPWGDKRRLKAVLAPPGVDWGPILDQALSALFWIVVVLALHRVASEPSGIWRRTIAGLFPSLLALVVMGWALLALVRRR